MNTQVDNETLLARKRRLLELAKAAKIQQKEEHTRAIALAARGAPLPLSFAQQRLWFIDQYEPGNAFYNIPLALRLSGALKADALQAALDEIVRRHEALRTTFVKADGVPLQQFADTLALPMARTDLSALPEAEREIQAQALVQAEADTPFDLATGPLLRASLVRLAEAEHLFLVTFHHIVSDGWSMAVFINELATLYGACAEGRPSPLAPLAIQYADFAAWQREWLGGGVLDRQLAYWKDKLAGAPALLALPLDRPRPATQNQRGAVADFLVPAATVQRLRVLNKETQATMFMTLAAAFKVLLARYCGQDDICIGTPIANRSRAEVEPLIGFFVNTLVLRTEVDPRASFLELLAKVRATALGAYAHQDVPFEQLIEALNPERQSSYSPLFQVMFSLQNDSGAELELSGLTFGSMAGERVSSKFDLSLNLNEVGDELRAGFEYKTDLFDAATIERMGRHFTHLLGELAAAPATAVGELALLDGAERKQLLVDWNDTARAYPDGHTIHALYEARAASHPDAVAVLFKDQQLSYGELNARANGLAHHLRGLGVGPDVLVGICVERSLDMIVGLLGILKAGGAYLPLDPSYPAERLAFMLDDAAPAVLVGQQHLLASLPEASIPAVCLDRDRTLLDACGGHNPAPLGRPDNLAYVIYTSGSTGRPKGVSVGHQAVNRLIFDTDYVDLLPSDTVAQAASNAFDATTFEVWGALLHGCRLCLVDPDVVMSATAFGDEIARRGITTLFITTALFNQFALRAPKAFGAMRHVLFGGEAVTPSLVETVLREGAPERLVHVYGPTESTTFALSCQVDAKGELKAVPIGAPIANTQAYILDAGGNPVPPGVAGELHIAGDGLARGYLKRPDLTAEKFVPNPFGAPGSRMYRTGDLTRYLADGNIDYLGRIDAQVKIRGFRIEPGEIETVLAALPGVREALVMAREDAPGDKRLAAYLVWEEGACASDAAALRAALLQTLPDYMVPSYFISIAAFPLTPNGKIDRRALPAPDTTRSGDGFVAPRTPTEEIVAGVWAALLKLDQVGIHDNFFALGGHSLLATQVLSKLRTAFGVELPLRTVFEAPTVAQLAQAVDRARQEQEGVRIPAITPVARDGALAPLSFAQQRLWFVDHFNPGQSIYNMPVALRLEGELNAGALHAALGEIVSRHESLRTTFVKSGGVPQQRIGASLDLPLPVADLSALPQAAREAQALALVQDEAAQPFDLAAGPLVRARLVRLAASEHLFLVTFHHIVSDGWSMGVFIGELAALYGAFVEGKPSPLPPLAVQYADVAHWQRQWLSGPVLEQQLAYWKDTLSGAPALLALPTDRPRPAVQTHRGALIEFAIPAATTAGLRELNKSANTTMFMTLAAAFNVLLARYSGQDDICIGTPIANRNRAETEALIGFFVNTLVLRTTVDAGASFLALLAQVRATALGAYAHQDVPFEQLIETLNPERQSSHSPLFQVLFALQNAPAGELVLPGLTLGAMPGEHATSKFDLSLSVSDVDGQLLGGFEFNTDLFDTATINRMALHFTHLLSALAAAPHTAVGDLQLLGEDERDELLVRWNATAAASPAYETIHAMFERQAESHPQAPAVVYEDIELSFGELNVRANRLARHLRSLGVGPDVLVGICVERSIDMVVGLLAILKAGGAYVPLDPSYPADRLAYMLDDSAPPVLLTQTALLGILPQGRQSVLCLDRLGAVLDGYSGEDLPHATTADNLAYVIYTSGSTGKPKGALLQHANVMRLFAATGHWFSFDEKDVWTVFHSYGFDFSVWEIWGALLHGGKLVVVPYMVSRSPEQFHALLASHKVTILNQTPSAFQQLVDYDLAQEQPAPLHLRSVIFGGEALNQAALAPWFARHGDRRPQLINMYGITETTVHVTYQPLTAAPSERSSIGRPIPDLATYILDPRMHPVPVGVAGELYVAGAGLARGYLNRADLSADRFVPDPFGAPGSRMYKSGDLARYLPDGRMEYLGRIDTQVKIRGFRIELSEIEAALSAVPGVREVLVLVREDQPGDKRLAAYLSWEAGAVQLDAGALRSALLRTLPDYMVPVYFIAIAQFPLTGNGKIDRRALPAPDTARSEACYVAPRNTIEAQLAAIWAEVLKLDRVGVHDNFFALGGHSLLAVSLIEKMRNAGLHTDIRVLFGTPTIAALAEAMGARREVVIPPNGIPAHCTRIEPAMLTLIELSAAHIAAVCAQVEGGAANIQDIYPLAPLQEGILFHHLMDPAAASYVTPMLIGFDARARLDGFMQALQTTVDRHDILRTVFLWDGLAEPVQAVLRKAALRIDQVALKAEGGDAIEQLRALGGGGVDPARAPLLRAVIAEDPVGGRWLLQLLAHHLVLDHTTLEILLAEVHDIMEGRADSLPAPLPFRNFVGQTRLGVSAQEHEAFFTAMLADVCEPTIPFGLQDVQGAATASGDARLVVDSALSARLRSQARKLGVSAASVMHLAWAQVLARVSGQDDVVFGSVLFGRMDSGAGSDRVLGMFINTLPVRIATAGQSAAQAVRSAHALLAQLLQHEHASLALAQRCSGVVAPTPLFSSLLNYRHSQVNVAGDGNSARAEWAGVELLAAEESSNYPFALSVDDLGEDFVLSAQVDGRVDPQRVCGYMHTVLGQLADALESGSALPVAAMEVLPEAEKQHMLVDWNDTGTAYPDQHTVHALFEEQAARDPDAVAVSFRDEQLTYAQLNARANALAHHLRTLGAGPDVLVGLCIERSLDMIVGLLAVLKSGAAYLPLDPVYPAERLAFMLDDAAPAVLLTQQHLLGRVPDSGIATVCMERDRALIAAHGAHNPAPLGRPDNLAYVIYTSGSTGRPKGVSVCHQAVSRLVFDTAYIDLRKGDHVAQAASNAFDATTFEVWGALLHGCRLCLVDADLVMSPHTFAAEIARQNISALFITTALFNQFALHAPSAFANMRYVLFGGEAVTPLLVEAVLEAGAPENLVHVYGPTESTTFALAHHVDKSARGLKGLAIGKPIGGTQAYVLDAAGNPVPAGVAGELHIGGDGLARSYLKRPDLTAEKFVPNPFGAPGSRMYRTGDLVRYLDDGSIDYLGRIDTQVKIRGFRIEPGEIEAALAAVEGVREALVLAREDVPGDKRLAAYLVWREGAQQRDALALRAALQQTLPDYMVPAHFIAVAQFPLTANGKIDRRALPAPDGARSDDGYVAPRTPTEEILAGIWATLLKLDRVGVHDNFFALGGHSLLATQAMSKLRAAFQVELGLRTIFEESTVARLALAVEAARETRHALAAAPMAPVARDGGLLPLSFAQQRLWFVDQFAPGKPLYNMPMALRLSGRLNDTALRRAVAAIVERHEALRTTFVKEGGVPRQRIAASLALPMALADLSALAPQAREAKARELVLEEASTPFDLQAGPLVRAGLVRLAAEEHLFLFTFHHIVSDGWSMGIFVNELAALYGAFAEDRPSPLAPLAIQYADFAHWQRQWLEGDVLEGQLAYWKGQLAGAPALLALPTDRPRPPLPSHRGATVDFAIPAPTVAGLQALNKRAHATMFMTLAAAFNVLLARYSGQDDICIGTPIANRNRAEVEPLIGFFVNTLVLRTSVDARASFLELLAQVRSTALGAYAHQDVPFEQLIETINPERQSSHSPLFQVMFALQNAPAGQLSLPGLTLGSMAAGQASAKFDLTLNVNEAGDELLAGFEYSTDLFDAATIEGMARHFARLLAALASSPEAALGEVALLDAAERHQLLAGWNDTATAFPDQHTIHALFEQQAARDPQATAVVFGDASLSYGELDGRANQLAHHLRRLGAGPDVLVGICVERSLEMIVGLMAILKAGAAYVPLDPSYPPERLAYMLDDAAPAVLLTQQHLAGRLPAIAGATFCIDSQWDALAACGREAPAPLALPDNLAYVIYTSGSTGKPKGAMLRHRGLCNLVRARIVAERVTPGQRMLQFASFNFDASTWEIFITLASGATLCMAPREAVMPGNLEGTLQRMQISMALLPPVVLTTLAQAELPHLQTIVSGGEACSAALANAWAAKAKFYNAYGPTEATVYATVASCEAGLAHSAPIGSPIANTQVYILDGAGQPVPAGVAGELHIAGEGLARGYLNRPDLTAAMFVPNPFGEAGSRMYKSGDLARWLPGGSVEYLGRADTQVKIRGFRIEPGEIEAALAALPGVREALVIAREDTPGDKRLAAYLIWEAGAGQLDTATLRAALLAFLPEYMVPACFIAIDAFPLTPNGKVDRRALPAPDAQRSAVDYVAPRTATEAAVAGIWASLLKLDRVGVHDNFFALGGHSLLATQVMSALRDTFDVELPLQLLFETATLEAFAQKIDGYLETFEDGEV